LSETVNRWLSLFTIKPLYTAQVELCISECTYLAGYCRTISVSWLLTLTNPMTILSFVAIFAGLGVGVTRGDYLAGAVVVLGVFAGSAAWWLILSTGAGLMSARLAPRAMPWINRISGAIIVAFGAATLISLIR
jgi:threonine/homoserine/homoserine lactone efflux protein